MSAGEVAKAAGGTLVNGKTGSPVAGIATDSRTVGNGQLFLPLKGETFDGNDFVAQAIKSGAAGSFVTAWNRELRAQLDSSLTDSTVVIKVADGLKAYQSLAAAERLKLNCTVIAITGSTGKTTTKDILTAMLAKKLRVVASERSYNNEVGVPATILRAGSDTDVLVLEMAMRGPGQIRDLCAIARPNIGLVTNVGKTHFEFFGSEERIAEAKGELVESIPADGLVVLNVDDYWTHKLRAISKAPVVTYGTKPSADVRASGISLDREGRPSFFLKCKAGRRKMRLPVPGRHNVYNTCAAAAVAMHLGLSLKEIAESGDDIALSGMRMELFTTADEVTILNDAYNANPASMKAALETLEAIEARGKKIAVLGDMMELGSVADAAHFQVGEMVAKMGLDLLVAVGAKSAKIADGAMVGGMAGDRVKRCANGEEAARLVRKMVSRDDVLLVKASRAMRLETVVESLT